MDNLLSIWILSMMAIWETVTDCCFLICYLLTMGLCVSIKLLCTSSSDWKYVQARGFMAQSNRGRTNMRDKSLGDKCWTSKREDAETVKPPLTYCTKKGKWNGCGRERGKGKGNGRASAGVTCAPRRQCQQSSTNQQKQWYLGCLPEGLASKFARKRIRRVVLCIRDQSSLVVTSPSKWKYCIISDQERPSEVAIFIIIITPSASPSYDMWYLTSTTLLPCASTAIESAVRLSYDDTNLICSTLQIWRKLCKGQSYLDTFLAYHSMIW